MAGRSDTFHGIPVWEITVFVAALALIFIVFVLWWFFGYSLVVAPSSETVVNPALAALLA